MGPWMPMELTVETLTAPPSSPETSHPSDPAATAQPGAAQSPATPPNILQIVPAVGWWLDKPSLDPVTGAMMTNRGRVLAFALCQFPDGHSEIRPIDDRGHIDVCDHIFHEADAGIISKYKKRARAAATGVAGAADDVVEDDEPKVASRRSTGEPPEPVLLKQTKVAIGEALQWVGDILEKDPGDDLLRAIRSQLRWMQTVVEGGRRPTSSELSTVRISEDFVPELAEDDPQLAQMLAEVEGMYRSL